VRGDEPFPLAERLGAQLLAGPPAAGPVEVVERLLAVQAQDARAARLAIRARTRPGSVASDVDRALSDERSLVVGWLMRGTLHLVRREDYRWLHALTAPRLRTTNARRLAREGVEPAAARRGVRVVERALAAEGPLTRDGLRQRVAAAGVRTEGQALVHILLLASLDGVIVRGPVVEGGHAYALTRDWLGEGRPVERADALAALARRYLAGHGPADERDLARWAGLPLADARAGLRTIGRELRSRSDGLLQLADGRRTRALPRPRLLGAFEPLLLGWRTREPLVEPHGRAIASGGIVRPIALVNGRAAATWTLRAGRIEIARLRRISRADADALEADGVDVLRFLGLNGG
jgi:Winged helix DNA-binding domain